MIKSLSISNFQSHKKTTLDFHEGVNVIVGPSDCGKTAILRALNWLVNNRPAGDEFKSRWGGETAIGLWCDKIGITRIKDKKNLYYVTNEKEQTTSFTAFGQDVPQEISEALNMDEINLQKQHDAPFLLSESPAEVARKLNKVASLESIDTANKNIAGIIRKLQQDEKAESARLANLKLDMEGYAHIEQMEQDVMGLERLQSKADRLRIDESKLSGLISKYNEIEQQLEETKDTADLEQRADELLGLIEQRKGVEKELIRLQQFLVCINDIEIKVNDYTREANRKQKQFDELMPEVCPLCGRGD